MKFFNFGKAFICIVLSLAMVLPLCSCGFDFDYVKEQGESVWNDVKDKGESVWNDVKDKGEEIWGDIKDKGNEILSGAQDLFEKAKDKISEWYGTAKDGVVYVYNEAAELTVTGYNKASAKANELIGDAKEFIAGLNKTPEPVEIKYAECDPDRPIKDLPAGVSFTDAGMITINQTFETEQFINYYISSVLAAKGYKVYNGAVYYKDNIYGGLIFTNEEVFIEEDGKKICSCGFIQLVSDDYSGVKITDDMVQSGLIAVSTGTNGTEAQAFIVDEYSVFDDFSGIFNNVYFRYRQIGHYVLSICLKENKPSNYENVELYDFDNGKIIKSASDISKEVNNLYFNSPESFEGAATTVNAIVDVEDNTDGDLSTVFVLDGGIIDTISEKIVSGASSVADFIQSGLTKITLNGNQFLSIDKNGAAHILGSENALNEERVTNGLISSIGSGLAATGAVASIVCVCKGGVIVVSAIVITVGVSAVVYNIANMLSGVQDVYYGAKGSVEESQNPVLNVFKTIIPDEELATLIYHIWGVANTVLSTIMMPISKALNIAKVNGLNAFQTAYNVIRAAVVTVAKAIATGIGAGIVANYVNKVVTKVSSNEYIGKLAGFGTSLITGMIIYKGLDAIDQKLDISGLYPKQKVLNAFNIDKTLTAESWKQADPTKLTKGEQERLINQLVDDATYQYGINNRPEIRICYDSNVDSYGGYNPNSNTLEINMNALGHKQFGELANTIGHEMQHAYQWQCINTGAPIDAAVKDSLINYITPTDNWEAYASQACEVDAEEAGNIFADLICDALAA